MKREERKKEEKMEDQGRSSSVYRGKTVERFSLEKDRNYSKVC